MKENNRKKYVYNAYFNCSMMASMKKATKKNCQIKYMQHWLEIAILWPFFV